MDPIQSIISPILVGRAAQLNTLAQLIQQVQEGRGQVALVSGEAGIGKSRLITEAKGIAQRLGFTLLEGACFEPDRMLPYAPFVDLMRTLSRPHPPGEIPPPAIPNIPELINLIPESAIPLSERAHTLSNERAQEKHLLFQAITQWLTEWAARQPLLVIIEDLHWSDETSLDALLYLARRLSTLPILLLISYRLEEVSPALSHFLAEIDRTHTATEVELRQLTKPEAGSMLHAIFGQDRPVRAELLDTIYIQTEGNPFFIEEILKALIAGGQNFFAEEFWPQDPAGNLHIPRSVQDAVHRRVAKLSEPARSLLMLAAVAGRRFDFTLLQLLTASSEDDLLHRIKETIAAQLVVEESAERFAFRHALTRQAIYIELLARERKTLHRLVLEALERMESNANDTAPFADAHLADLAYHASKAEVWEKAYTYSRRAGENAQLFYAPREAVEHLTRAMVAARRLAAHLDAELVRARGQAYELLGNFSGAQTDYEQALALAHEAREGLAEWQALIDLGFLWASRDYARAGEYFRRATELSSDLANPRLHARSLNRWGNWLVNVGQMEEGLLAHRQALEIFEIQQDPAGAAETLDLLGMANTLYGDMEMAQQYSRQAIQQFQQLGEKRVPISDIAVMNVGAGFSETVQWAPRTLADCERDGNEALHLARQLDWPAGQAQTEWTLAVALSSYGQLGAGLGHALEARRISQMIEHRQWLAAANAALGHVYILMLQPDAAQETLEAGLPLAKELGSIYWIGNIASYLAQSFLLKNEPERAERILQPFLPEGRPPRNLPERRLLWAWASVKLAQNAPAQALSVIDQLIATAPGSNRTQPIPALLKLKGESLIAMKRFAEAEQALAHARLGAEERGGLPLLWQIHAALARTYRKLNRAEDAQIELDAALEIIESLATTIDDAPLRESFRRLAIGRLPEVGSRSPRQAEKVMYSGLTRREREIAVQVSQGKTNRQIAAELALSERTVENHVTNILSKLNFDTRVQIAAWVVSIELENKNRYQQAS